MEGYITKIFANIWNVLYVSVVKIAATIPTLRGMVFFKGTFIWRLLMRNTAQSFQNQLEEVKKNTA